MSFLSTLLDRSVMLASPIHRDPMRSSPPTSTSPAYSAAPQVFPPPPITGSIYQTAPSSPQTGHPIPPTSAISPTLSYYRRQARALEAKLQELLDLQSEALLRGYGANDEDPTGSRTPTAASASASVSSPGRNSSPTSPPPRRQAKPSVQNVRKQITRTIKQLSEVKAHEAELLEEELGDYNDVVGRIRDWEERRRGLRKEIDAVRQGETGKKMVELRGQDDRLEGKIRELEERLRILKRKQRTVREELAALESETEAKVASYREALEAVEKDIKSFLEGRSGHAEIMTTKEPGYLKLPRKRRTLDMAEEYWKEERGRAERRAERAEFEKEALDQGAVLWGEVVERLGKFDRDVREELKKVPWGKASRGDIEGLMQLMVRFAEWLEGKWQYAEERHWTLLMCTIGSELEAVRQGREAIEKPFVERGKAGKSKPERERDPFAGPEDMPDGRSPPPPWNGTSSAYKNGVPAPPARSEDVDFRSESTDASTRGEPSFRPTIKHKPFDTDDDEPDPELLISHQETDTD